MKAHFHLKATLFHNQEKTRTKKTWSRQQSLNFREALHKRVECVYVSDHDYIQRVQQQQANVAPRWDHPIIRPPQFKIAFWNVNYRALASIEKTNNAMEASHQQMVRELNHHPARSDLLFALKSDIDKQCDIARAARSFNHVRRKQYVIRENRLMTTLARAEHASNEDLLNMLTLIGLQLQGYVAGIRVEIWRMCEKKSRLLTTLNCRRKILETILKFTMFDTIFYAVIK
ncbi:hypothetical protein GPALN_012362 [Globodera pallida]|nr:hypothetical protein GPALN_012362 [Globodera pallida]